MNDEDEGQRLRDALLEAIGPEALLEDLLQAMPTGDVVENLRFVARMRDVEVG